MHSQPTTDSLLSLLAAQLVDLPLFRPLGAEQRLQVARRAVLVEAQLGEAIVREGELTRDLFIMLSGEAAVTVRLPETSEALEVGHVRPPEMLGELSMLLDEPRAASVVARRPCHLLRFDGDTFRELLSTVPGLALSFSQEMARRFRGALEEKNELQGELVPGPSSVRRSEITQPAMYLARYYASALQGVLRRHQLLVSGAFPRFEDRFRFTAEEQQRWFELFGVTGAEKATPFTYYTTSGTMALMQQLREVGVNFRYLMHLRSEMSFNPDGRTLEPGRDYRCVYRLTDIVELRSDRVALVSEVEIHDEAERPMLLAKDFWIIKNLAPEYVSAIRRARRLGRHDTSQFQGLAKRQPTLAAGAVLGRRQIAVPADMGVAYGRVSGDMNMVHTTAVAARLIGYKRPFVQGLCTANYVLQTLTGASGGPPRTFHISFCKQLFVGEAVEIRYTATEFEVCDRRGQLLAYGAWSQGRAAEAPVPMPMPAAGA